MVADLEKICSFSFSPTHMDILLYDAHNPIISSTQ
jgi:hypothetical protein